MIRIRCPAAAPLRIQTVECGWSCSSRAIPSSAISILQTDTRPSYIRLLFGFCVARPVLELYDERAARLQNRIYLSKQSQQAIVTMIEMNPLENAETMNEIVVYEHSST